MQLGREKATRRQHKQLNTQPKKIALIFGVVDLIEEIQITKEFASRLLFWAKENTLVRVHVFSEGERTHGASKNTKRSRT